MTPRAATWISRGVLVACLVAIAASAPLHVASRDAETTGIVVVGDPEAPRVDELRAELQQRLDAGEDFVQSDSAGGGVVYVVLFCLLWVGTGSLIVSRQPRNWAGWIFIAVGAPLPLLALLQALVVYGTRAAPGSVPFLRLWATLGEFALYPVALLPLLFLLYPDGRLPSRRWRWSVWGLFCGVGASIVGFLLRPGPQNNWVGDGLLIVNPLGIDAADTLGSVLITFGAMIGLVAALSTVVAVRQRYRRSEGEARQQMRWLAFVGVVAGTAITLQFVLLPITLLVNAVAGTNFGESSSAFEIPFAVAVFTLVIGVPAAYLVAIYRYRLYDLDVVIKKTVQYGVLVVAFTAVGGVVIAIVPALVFGIGSSVATGPVLLLAALISGAFLWLRPRAGRLANRIVYGKRATPYEVLSEFSERVGETYSTDDVLPRMTQLVAEATGARRVDIWLVAGSVMRPEARWPADVAPAAARPVPGDAVPVRGAEHVVEVRHQGELLGAITLEPAPDDPMNAAKDSLVQDLASQAGLVLRNVRLIEDLRSSRQRLVAAQDEERRKLERNIHDGVQQQLVALSVQVRLAEQLTERDPAMARETLAGLQELTSEALEDLRDLARGIYPPLLADKGLHAALEAQGRKSTVPVHVEAGGIGRYPQEIEAAVYFSCLESLNNVAKYAEAREVHIDLGQRNGALEFSVADDGKGFDPATTGYGTGLQGIADRLDAIGGSVRIEAAPGEGTTLTGTIPTEGKP